MNKLLLIPALLLGLHAIPALAQTGASAPTVDIRSVPVKTDADLDERIRKKTTDLSQAQPTTQVWQDGELILELTNNRFIRFRSGKDNDLWISTKRRTMDLAWSYQDVNDFAIDRVESKRTPQGFSIAIAARKPSVQGKVNLLVEARWNAARQQFEYMLSSTLDASLEDWWSVSKWAKAGAYTSRRPGASLDAFDYHVNRISTADLLENGYDRSQVLYDAFVRSRDGATWEKWPKLHVSFTTRKGSYIGLNALDSYQIEQDGEYFGFLDQNEGGWMTRLLERPETPGSSVSFMLCWFYQDVHFLLRNAVPPRGTSERFTLRYKVHFIPQSPAEARKILSTATELPWRESPDYQLPVFSRDNRFDRLIGGGRDTEWAWFASSWDCVRDDTVGFDDRYSVRISSETPGAKAWYANTWGRPMDEESLSGGRFRITARVKTENVTGFARLAVVTDNSGDYWIHSPGEKERRGKWESSATLTGTHDWQTLSLEFTPTGHSPAIVLEQEGPGTSWFDNVKIERLR